MPPDPAAPGAAEVTAIVVCYHSGALVRTVLERLPPEMPRIFVDNAPESQDHLLFRDAPEGVLYLRNARNLGFGAAVNVAARRVETPFLLILNPDVRVGAAELGECLRLAAQPGVGIVGELRYPWLAKKLLGLKVLPHVTGAFMLMRKRVFEEVGGFDEDFFLFFEDADLSLRVRRRGYRLVGPRGRIDHVDGQSVAGAHDRRAERRWLMGASARIFVAKHPWSLDGLRWRIRLRRWARERGPDGRPGPEAAGAAAALREGPAALWDNHFATGNSRTG